MVGGISLIGVITATVASWIVDRVAQEDNAQQAVTAAEIDELRAEIRCLTSAVEHRNGSDVASRPSVFGGAAER
jgi:voltage-gated potassium channel